MRMQRMQAHAHATHASHAISQPQAPNTSPALTPCQHTHLTCPPFPHPPAPTLTASPLPPGCQPLITPKALHRTLGEMETAARGLQHACADMEATCTLLQQQAPPVMTSIEAASAEVEKLGLTVNALLAPLAPRRRPERAQDGADGGDGGASADRSEQGAGDRREGGVNRQQHQLAGFPIDGRLLREWSWTFEAGAAATTATSGSASSSAPGAVTTATSSSGGGMAGLLTSFASASSLDDDVDAGAPRPAGARSSSGSGSAPVLDGAALQLRSKWAALGAQGPSKRSLARLRGDLRALTGLINVLIEPLWPPAAGAGGRRGVVGFLEQEEGSGGRGDGGARSGGSVREGEGDSCGEEMRGLLEGEVTQGRLTHAEGAPSNSGGGSSSSSSDGGAASSAGGSRGDLADDTSAAQRADGPAQWHEPIAAGPLASSQKRGAH